MTVIGAAFGAGRNCWSTLYFYQKINHSRKYVRKSERRSGCSLRTIKNRKSIDESNHVGPLIDTDAVKMYENAEKSRKKRRKTSRKKVGV